MSSRYDDSDLTFYFKRLSQAGHPPPEPRTDTGRFRSDSRGIWQAGTFRMWSNKLSADGHKQHIVSWWSDATTSESDLILPKWV